MEARTYVLGIGNPAREDDGIGPAVADAVSAAVEAHASGGVTVESNYQLTVEDAAEVAEHDRVVFVDAAVGDSVVAEGRPFSFVRVTPRRSESFSTHSVLPQDVLGMAHEMFGSKTKGYLLSVRGYSFSMFTEGMTDGARANAEAAVGFLIDLIDTQDFERVAGGSA